MTCKDCGYFLECGNHEELRDNMYWCPSWVLCSYYNKTGTIENDWSETCVNFVVF